MTWQDIAKPAGVILAGGRASRLGATSKALAPLAGQPLVWHVLQRLKPQVEPVVLSVQETLPELSALCRTQVEDQLKRYRGPLTGLYSAMQWLEENSDREWLLLCPCDAPFMPRDLGARLGQAAAGTGRSVAVAQYEDLLQPTFSLWHMGLLPTLREAVTQQGRGGMKQMLREVPHTAVEWAVRDLPPFFNVNTPDDLAHAEQLLDRGVAKA